MPLFYVLAIKKLNRVAHAEVIGSAGNITDGNSVIEKVSAVVVVEKINDILVRNSSLLEEWQAMALSSILGRTLIEGTKFVPIDRDELQQGLLSQNQTDSYL